MKVRVPHESDEDLAGAQNMSIVFSLGRTIPHFLHQAGLRSALIKIDLWSRASTNACPEAVSLEVGSGPIYDERDSCFHFLT